MVCGPVVAWSRPRRDLAPPSVDVVADSRRGNIRELTLQPWSQRGARAVGLWVDDATATVHEATVAGRAIPINGARGRWNIGILFEGTPPEGVQVRIVAEQRTDDLVVRVADRSDDLGDVPRFAPPPRGCVLVTPEVVVTRSLRL